MHVSSPVQVAAGRAAVRAMAGDFTDPKHARLVLLAAGGLAAVGLLLLAGTIVWWRNSRVEHPALAPLEMMSVRRFAKAADGEQRRLLDEVRPEGAVVAPAIRHERVDLRGDVSTAASRADNFDDLRDAEAATLAALAEVTKGLAKPATPKLAELEEMLDAHRLSDAPAVTGDESLDPDPEPEPEMASANDGPIDPLLQRFESSER